MQPEAILKAARRLERIHTMLKGKVPPKALDLIWRAAFELRGLHVALADNQGQLSNVGGNEA